MSNVKLCVSLFNHAKDNQPKQKLVDWEWVIDEIIKKPTVVKSGKRIEDVKIKMPAFSFVKYKNGSTRGKDGAICVFALVGDVDQAKNATKDEFLTMDILCESARRNGVAMVCYYTISSTEEKPKIRFIVPLYEPIPVESWRDSVMPLLKKIGLDDPSYTVNMDLKAMKNAAGIYFGPSRFEGANYDYVIVDGEPLVPPPLGRSDNSHSSCAKSDDIPSTEKHDSKLDLIMKAKKLAIGHPPAIAGERGHDVTFELARKLVSIGLSSADVLDVMMNVYNKRCDPLWTENELIHKVEDAFKSTKYKNKHTTNDVKIRSPWSIRDVFPDCPADLLIPPKYEIDDLGVRQVDSDGKYTGKSLPRVILPIMQMVDSISGRHTTKIAWYNGNTWIKLVADRSTLKDKAITRLASEGLPVASHNASLAIQFIDDVENINSNRINIDVCTSSLGWKWLNGIPLFQYNASVTLGFENTQQLVFNANDNGEKQLAMAPRVGGSLEEWKRAVSLLACYPKVMMVIHGSFSAPLLEPLGSQVGGFTISMEGRTSTGKTSAELCGNSVWYCPIENGFGSAMSSFDSTSVGLERKLALLYSLPFFVDDTKRAQDPKLVADFPYLVSQGIGRGRGSKTGLDVLRTWKTIAVVSGEAPLESYTNNGGAHARTLPIRGALFGPESKETAETIARVLEILSENYGHAGLEFVKKIQEEFLRDGWQAIRSRHRELIASYATHSHVGAIQRQATFAATIHLAGELATEWGILPGPFRAPMRTVWREIVAEADDPSGERRAYFAVIDWAKANPLRFQHWPPPDRSYDPAPPVQGWAGVWLRSSPTGTAIGLGFYPHVLHEVLRGLRYDTPEGIINGWADLGLLQLGEPIGNGRRRTAKQVRMRAPRRLIVLDLKLANEEVERELGDE